MNAHAIHHRPVELRPEAIRNHERENELHNLAVCAEIGAVAETGHPYSAGLSRRIAATGKAIEALTVGELLALHRDYGDRFSLLHADPRPDRQAPNGFADTPASRRAV